MRYLVVPVPDGLEIHSPACAEAGEGEIVNAANAFGAAVDYWGRKTPRNPLQIEQRALLDSRLFPCGANAGKPTRRTTPRALPFALEAGDGEILSAVMGRAIRWVNSRTGGEEQARLYPDGPFEKLINGRVVTSFPHNFTRINVTSSGHRVLNFLDMAGTGFRAARVDSIVSVR